MYGNGNIGEPVYRIREFKPSAHYGYKTLFYKVNATLQAKRCHQPVLKKLFKATYS